MFRIHPSEENNRLYLVAFIGLACLSTAALVVTIWVMIEFLKEQAIVEELMKELPREATESAQVLAGDLRWQFRLSILVLLNVIVTAIAVVLLWRAHRASQRSLRDTKALAGYILSSIDQAIITTDVQGNVTGINERGLQTFGTDMNCLEHPLKDLSRVVDLEQLRIDWKKGEEATLVRDLTVRFAGQERVLRAVCQTLSDFEGHEIGNVLQVRDVTQTTLIEQRMRRMERYMGLGSLAAGLHHEIKNPLAALSLHVQLLEEQLEKGDDDDSVEQLMGVIKTEVNRVSNVLEGFRDFASIDDLSLDRVDMASLIKHQVDLLKPRAQNSGIEIKREIEPNLPAVSGDQVRLEQVLLNLLLNAFEAMPDGGSLTVSATSNEAAVYVTVSDTGCGISQDLRERVFDPYFTTKSQGTGLGLAICDKIMRQHAGSLDLRSTELGTTFELKVPIDYRDAADGQSPRKELHG